MDEVTIKRIEKECESSLDHRAWDFLYEMSRPELIRFLMETMTTRQWSEYREDFRDDDDEYNDDE
tara:strand:+ start:4508 stop:4702 length:195 start_codon:yes stop_codon:yes gene_type:complete